MPYQGVITIEPGKRGGKPCIRGMRITVYDCVGIPCVRHESTGDFGGFPYLTQEDILACLSFAANRERLMVALQPGNYVGAYAEE